MLQIPNSAEFEPNDLMKQALFEHKNERLRQAKIKACKNPHLESLSSRDLSTH